MNKIGIVGRFFPIHYRPALQEVQFLAENDFTALQFPGLPQGLSEKFLGSSFAEIRALMAAHDIQATMEIVFRVEDSGLNQEGQSLITLLEKNLSAILDLGCSPVHFHIVPTHLTANLTVSVSQQCLADLKIALRLAQKHNFILGFEHNDPAFGLYADPSSVSNVLLSLPDLGFVWDTNHTAENKLGEYSEYFQQLVVVHVSDSPLPELNYHWSLGRGAINFEQYLKPVVGVGFTGPYVLEVGGLPKSGGYGQDTDEAVLLSRDKLIATLKNIAI